MKGINVFAGAVNDAVLTAIGGDITYGLNSAVTGQPFDWKGMD